MGTIWSLYEEWTSWSFDVLMVPKIDNEREGLLDHEYQWDWNDLYVWGSEAEMYCILSVYFAQFWWQIGMELNLLYYTICQRPYLDVSRQNSLIASRKFRASHHTDLCLCTFLHLSLNSCLPHVPKEEEHSVRDRDIGNPKLADQPFTVIDGLI